ncbi:MAG: hypothetical protein JJU28_11865 [Cyclobacteriaceae bacterium]|nr:hypothetical protein [Cyclobacteriaceae bacterium]
MKSGCFILFVFLGVFGLFSCKEKLVCPAYHSYFILDPNETLRHFALFDKEDSVPNRDGYVAKTKFGIYDEPSYRRKEKEIKTVSRNSIYISKYDPFLDLKIDRRLLTRTQTDSIYVSNKPVEDDFYNVDQMIYLYHFGQYLPKSKFLDEDIDQDTEEEGEEIWKLEEEDLDTDRKKRKLFGGRKKKETTEAVEEEEEENYEIWP